MSGEVGTSQTEVDLKALEGFLVGNQDLERLDALCSTTSTSSRPPDGTGDGYEDEWMRRSAGSSKDQARQRALP
jgi:hypothetical protein